MRHLNFILCLPSPIEFNGLCSLLRNIRGLSASFREVDATAIAENPVIPGNTDVFICDPLAVAVPTLRAIKSSLPKLKIVLLYHTALPRDIVKEFDAAVSIYDSESVIEQAIVSLFATRRNADTTTELTQREKEIVIGVVKGLSNKEIANRINVSVNTVMTHRRNIAAKLEIHSPAGLTVYALMSNLITLDELSE